ncbi:hypothetical protein EBR96_04865 [bacterium]|nr:hypothetical protein [bacterium]
MRILVIGCGWVGSRVAGLLATLGHHVIGTVSGSVHRPMPASFERLIWKTGDIPVWPDSAYDAVICLIPFRRNVSDPTIYRTQIREVKEIALSVHARHLIWTSSTAVYGECQGPVTERDEPVGETIRQEVLLSIERELDSAPIDTLTVRLGGLVGPDRTIVSSLSRRQSVSDGYVNLVHIDDAVGFLVRAVLFHVTGVLNLVAPIHPLKSELYTAWARTLNQPVPIFLGENISKKIVDSSRIGTEFPWMFLAPDPKKWMM